MSKNTKTSRETPDILRPPARTPDPRVAGGPGRHASTGANTASGDAETALLVGAP